MLNPGPNKRQHVVVLHQMLTDDARHLEPAMHQGTSGSAQQLLQKLTVRLSRKVCHNSQSGTAAVAQSLRLDMHRP